MAAGGGVRVAGRKPLGGTALQNPGRTPDFRCCQVGRNSNQFPGQCLTLHAGRGRVVVVVAAVSILVGFGSPAVFPTAFSRQFGNPPSAVARRFGGGLPRSRWLSGPGRGALGPESRPKSNFLKLNKHIFYVSYRLFLRLCPKNERICNEYEWGAMRTNAFATPAIGSGAGEGFALRTSISQRLTPAPRHEKKPLPAVARQPARRVAHPGGAGSAEPDGPGHVLHWRGRPRGPIDRPHGGAK